jgi:hypothetical protein
MTEQEPNPFDGCDSTDEIMFLVQDHEGPEALEKLLDLLIAESGVDRDTLERAAEKLAAAGLPQAAMVLEAAGKVPSKDEMEVEAILADPDPCNRKARLAALHRLSKLGGASLEYLAGDADQDTLAFVEAGRIRRSLM